MTNEEFNKESKKRFEEMMETYYQDESDKIAGQPEPQAKVVDKAVDNPTHYKWFDIEAIDLIEKALTTEEFIGYLKGCSLKYRLRMGKKKRSLMMQDLAKAEKYEWFYDQFVKRNQP